MLTTKQIEAAKPRDKEYRLFDGAGTGLHLLVTPAGGRLWRAKYRRPDGRPAQAALGRFPHMTLADARLAVADLRRKLRDGIDPASRPASVATAAEAERFESVARAWHTQNVPAWTPVHSSDVIRSLERMVFPVIGQLHVNQITVPAALALLREVERENGGETARRVRQRCSAVSMHAIASGFGTGDPFAIIKTALAPITRDRQPAATTLAEARAVLAAVEGLPAHPATLAGFRLLALTAVRPDNVNGARWEEFDLTGDNPTWTIPATRMKCKAAAKKIGEPHIVPLSKQAVELLESIKPLTGRSPFVFPNSRHAHEPMSENALSFACKRAGLRGRHVPHGWRATFSSVMNELRPDAGDAIERVLAHAPRDRVRAAYNRAAYLDQRRALLQEWADLLLADAADPVVLMSGPRR